MGDGLVNRERKDVLAYCALTVLLRLVVFVIFVKGQHLIEHIFGNLMKWCHNVRGDCNLDVAQLTNYGLELGIVNSIQRFNDLQVVILFVIFVYCRLDWSEVLLVA